MKSLINSLLFWRRPERIDPVPKKNEPKVIHSSGTDDDTYFTSGPPITYFTSLTNNEGEKCKCGKKAQMSVQFGSARVVCCGKDSCKAEAAKEFGSAVPPSSFAKV